VTLIGRLVKALGALVITAGISGGVPWALLTWIGNPIPRHIPALHTVQWWLSSRFDIHAFLAIVVYLLWAAWAVFVMQLFVQVPGVIADLVRIARHREPVRRDVASGPGGALVRGLIAAFTITLLAPRGVGGQTSARAATGYVVSASARSGVSAPALPGARTESDATHVVAAGESLWDIAAQHLGDPDRWGEIFELNVGRPQPGGGELTDAQLILPGWRLRLPDVSAPQVPKKDVSTRASAAASMSAGTGPENVLSRLTVRIPEIDPAAPQIPLPIDVPTQASGPELGIPASSPGAQHGSKGKRIAPRDRAAVRLPGGGTVPIELAGGVAAAVALARLRTRAKARLRPIETDSVREPRGLDPTVDTLVRAHQATLCAPGRGLFQDDDDFGDDPYADADQLGSAPAAVTDRVDELWSLTEVVGEELSEPVFAASFGDGLGTTAASVDIHFAVRDNIPVPLASISGSGLGLVGDGAADTARSVLLSALAAGGPGTLDQAAQIRTTASLFSALFGPDAPAVDSERLTAFATLADLLDHATAEQAARAAEVAEYGYASAADVRRYAEIWPFHPCLYLAELEAGERHRLDLVARASAAVDTHLVLLGPWAAGTTVEVAADHSISAAGDNAAALSGASAFGIGFEEAREILKRLSLEAVDLQEDEPFTDTAADDGEAAPLRLLDTPYEPVRPQAASVSVSRVRADTGTLAINLMGPFAAEIDGRDVSSTFSPSHRTLLTYLALYRRPIRRADITDALWADDEDDSQKAKAKRKVRFDTRLHQTKKALAAATGRDDDFITSDRSSGLVSLNRALVLTDLACFDDLVAQAVKAADDEARIAHLEAACALYRGPLDESIRGHWLLEHREDRLRRYRDAAGDLARLYGRTDPDRGLATLNTLLEHDLFNEDLYRRIMRGQARLGRSDAVRRTFNLLEVRFEALGMEVDQETRDLLVALTRKRAA
jgi:DNA-binding SARP family transcriptional activator